MNNALLFAAIAVGTTTVINFQAEPRLPEPSPTQGTLPLRADTTAPPIRFVNEHNEGLSPWQMLVDF